MSRLKTYTVLGGWLHTEIVYLSTDGQSVTHPSGLDYKNVVVSSVMEVFVRSEEYRKAYDFANVKPCNNKDTITYCLREKFTESIVSDMNVVQWLILA